MNYNPYAAPQAAPPNPGGPGAYGTGPQPWEIGEVFAASWEAFKNNWAVLVFSLVLTTIISWITNMAPRIPSIVGVFRIGSTVDWVLTGTGMLLGLAVGSFLRVGLWRIYLATARGQQADFGMLFSGADRFVAVLAANIILLFAMTLGCTLLMVPGVLLACGLCFTDLLVVDQGLGPIEALQASWQATTGQKMQIFLFGLVAFCVILASELLCCLPVLAATPVVMVALTIIYLRVTGRGAPPPQPAPGTGFGPPGGGGYGPPGGGFGPPGGGGNNPPPGGGGYGPPGGGGGGYGPPGGGGGGYGPPGGGGGYGPPGGGGGYGPPGGGGGYGPPGGGGGPTPGGWGGR